MTNEELYYLPASELLKHIQAEKERLIKEKVIKKSKPLSPITEEEKPYDLPAGWEWVRLDEISLNITDGAHKTPTYVDFGVPFLSIKDITFENIDFNNTRYISELEHNELIKRAKVEKGDILFSRIGTLDRIIVVDTNQEFSIFVSLGLIKLLQDFINPKYIRYCMLSPYFRNYVEKVKVVGSHASKFNLGDVKNSPIPLPPLYIQDQIVQKLEQLSETKNSLLSHAEFQLNYTKKMREALLQEAICGELVPQNANDEPASILLEKIKTEKERLIKEKVIKKQKELPPITEDEKPYGLPKGWEWVRLGNVVDFIDYRGKTPKKTDCGIKLITAKNIKFGFISYTPEEFIDEEDYDTWSVRGIPQKGDVVFTTEAPMGNVAIIDINEKFVLAQRAVCFPQNEYIINKFLMYCIMSKEIQTQLVKRATGTTVLGIKAAELKQVLLPLPPLAEQERIATKLDELMAHCNQLEVKAEEMKNYTSKLFEASLKEAFMPDMNGVKEKNLFT